MPEQIIWRAQERSLQHIKYARMSQRTALSSAQQKRLWVVTKAQNLKHESKKLMDQTRLTVLDLLQTKASKDKMHDQWSMTSACHQHHLMQIFSQPWLIPESGSGQPPNTECGIVSHGTFTDCTIVKLYQHTAILEKYAHWENMTRRLAKDTASQGSLPSYPQWCMYQAALTATMRDVFGLNSAFHCN